MLKTINTKKSSGFTLVEMLVAIAVFMIVMTAAVGSLVSIIDANRKAQAIKDVMNNINFALESISKDMRVGTGYECFGSSGYTNSDSECRFGKTQIRYIPSYSNDYTYYRFVKAIDIVDDMGNIQKCSAGTCPANGWESLTAPTGNVNITSMNFYVLGADTANNPAVGPKQPRVLITIEGMAGKKESVKTSFNIQTTVTQRIKEDRN
jgi:prepilin-type N-terminal cleavage/methylation domain-containing protein